MNLSSEQLLFISALNVRRRFVRLCSLLNDAGRSATSGKGLLIASLLESTREQLDEYISGVAELDEGAAVKRRKVPGPWDQDSRQRLAKEIYNGHDGFRSKHEEAYPYISEFVKVPNDLRHFLFRSLDLSLVSSTHTGAVALYPSQHLMWESTSSGIGDDAKVAAILVPYSETASPLRWPLLVHELAHHLSPNGDDSDSRREEAWRGEDDADRARLDDGLRELQADAIAENATGIAYSVALALESPLLLHDHHLRKGGPTVKHRLEYLTHGKAIANVLPEEWRLDGSSAETQPDDSSLTEDQLAKMIEVADKFGDGKAIVSALLEEWRLDGSSVETQPDDSSLTEDQLAKMIEVADKLGDGRARSVRSELVDRALELKAEGDPIPAVPRYQSHSQTDFENARSLDLAVEEDREKIRQLFLSLADVPLSDSDILEAAWSEDLRKDTRQIRKELLAPTDDSSMSEEMTALDQQDVLLSRSLQAAAVHRWLVSNDEVIREAVADPEPSEPSDEYLINAAPLIESSPLSDLQLARRLTLPPRHEQRLVVRPLVDPGQVGGTTIDLRLGTEWETLRTSRFHSLDPSDDASVVTDLLNESADEFRLTAGEAQGLVLHPGELLLALTLEYLRLPKDVWGQLEGRSTWARVGLQVHATAGMIDAGFAGFLTLELQNTGRLPIVLYPGLRVCQMAFFPVSDIVRPYNKKPGSAYANQAKVRTAFTTQHEHKARHAFIENERLAENERRTSNGRVRAGIQDCIDDSRG